MKNSDDSRPHVQSDAAKQTESTMLPVRGNDETVYRQVHLRTNDAAVDRRPAVRSHSVDGNAQPARSSSPPVVHKAKDSSWRSRAGGDTINSKPLNGGVGRVPAKSRGMSMRSGSAGGER
jgi:hypothetical protein